MIVDGPPGPLKLIHFEIDYESESFGQSIVPYSPEFAKTMAARLSSISTFVQQNI